MLKINLQVPIAKKIVEYSLIILSILMYIFNKVHVHVQRKYMISFQRYFKTGKKLNSQIRSRNYNKLFSS